MTEHGEMMQKIRSDHRSHCTYEEDNGVCRHDGYGAESHCHQCVERAIRARQLLRFVDHEYHCSWLQVNWNKGPCDCGLHDLLSSMSTEELQELEKWSVELVAGFRRWQREQ